GGPALRFGCVSRRMKAATRAFRDQCEALLTIEPSPDACFAIVHAGFGTHLRIEHDLHPFATVVRRDEKVTGAGMMAAANSISGMRKRETAVAVVLSPGIPHNRWAIAMLRITIHPECEELIVGRSFQPMLIVFRHPQPIPNPYLR